MEVSGGGGGAFETNSAKLKVLLCVESQNLCALERETDERSSGPELGMDRAALYCVPGASACFVLCLCPMGANEQ